MLEKVEVTAPAEPLGPSLTQPDLEGAKMEIRHAPGGVAIVDAESYREGRVSTIKDALGFAPGVFVQPRFGAEESRISIRGSGLQRTFHLRGIKLMQDGVPLNLADGGGDFQAIEPLATRYIEVFRGANALQYGSTTLGGAINYVSPTGYDVAPLSLRSEVGSYEYLRSQIAAGGVLGSVDGAVSLSTYSQDGFRQHSRQNAQRLVGNAGLRLNDDLETRFYVQQADSDSELPGSLTKQQLQNDPRQANASSVSGNQKRDIDFARLANKTTWRFGASRLELFAYYADKDLFHPIFQVLDQHSEDYGAELRFVSNERLAGMDNRFVMGVAYARGNTDDDRWQNISGRRGARTNSLKQTARNSSAYAEEQLTFIPEWTAVIGTQYARARRKNRDLFFATPAQDESFEKTYSAWSPKLGLRWDLRPSIQAFANVSRSFEPPSFGELVGGQNPVLLNAQRGTTFELGTRGELASLQWDAAVYRARIRDEMLQTNILAAGNSGPAPVTVNVPRTIHQGVELAMSGKFGGGFEWRQALLINDFKFDGDSNFGDNDLPGVPRSLVKGELGYRFTAAPGGPLLLAINAEWSPQDYAVDMSNTLFADSYTIWGLRLQQQIGKHVSWFVEGRNLTDEKYAATTGVIRDARAVSGAALAQFLPGDGRTFYAGLEWKL